MSPEIYLALQAVLGLIDLVDALAKTQKLEGEALEAYIDKRNALRRQLVTTLAQADQHAADALGLGTPVSDAPPPETSIRPEPLSDLSGYADNIPPHTD